MSHSTCKQKGKTLGHSTKHPAKRNRRIDVVLLHRERYLNLNRHIRHGRVLTITNTGLWSHVQKKYHEALDKRRNVLGHLDPLKKDRSRNSCIETCRISHIGHILGPFKGVCIGVSAAERENANETTSAYSCSAAPTVPHLWWCMIVSSFRIFCLL